MAKPTPVTPEEVRALEESIQSIVPGFQMFDYNRFMAVAMHGAVDALRGVKEVQYDDGAISIPLLTRYVCKSPLRKGYGVPFVWWWIYAEMNILAGIDSDPWSQSRWWLWECDIRGTGKCLTMHGSQNSSKTSTSGRFAVVQMVIWTADAVVYIASPHKSHGEDKTWKDTLGQWGDYLKTTAGTNKFLREYKTRINTAKHLVEIWNEGDRYKAVAKFVAADESSTIRGKKSTFHDPSGLRGITLVFVDEFVENPYLDLKGINSNASSNYNFVMLLACNPDPAKTNHPAIREFSAPLDIVNLDRTRHFRWRTAFGLCVRFAWSNCPNRVIGRTRWPYLLDQIRVERAKDKGSNIIDAEVDAWFQGSGASGAPLDEATIKLVGTYKNNPDDRWTTGRPVRFMFLDCAFGGKDPAVAFIGEAGKAMFTAGGDDSVPFERDTIAACAQEILDVRLTFPVTQEWLSEMKDLLAWSGGDWPAAVKTEGVKVGNDLNGNYHCAYLALRACREWGVQPTHFAFDSSQRGDITTILQDFFGRHNIKWWYEGTRKLQDEEKWGRGWFRWPYVYTREDGQDEEKPELWSQYCTQTISMAWFFACEVIKRGWLSRGEQCRKGLDELCSRPIVKRRGGAEGQKDVISKDKLKDMGIKSPAYGETLALGIYFAIRFLGLIKLDEPKTAMHIMEGPASTTFIRGGHNRMPRGLLRMR